MALCGYSAALGQPSADGAPAKASDQRITATQTCDAATLRGVYASRLTGTVFGQPYQAVSFQVFDGQGKTWGVGTEATPVVTERVALEGTYSVDPECVAELRVKGEHLGQPIDEHTIDLYLSVAGERAFLVVSSTDFVGVPAEEELPADTITVSGVMERLWTERRKAKTSCDLRTIRGVYAAHAAGNAFGFDVAAAGQIVFDGNGNLSGRLTEVVDGMVDDISFAGTYSVGSDCSGTMKATFAPVNEGSLQPVHDHTFEFYLAADGSRFFVILTSTTFDDAPDVELPKDATVVSGVGERL
jgi:hypothetical protein